MNGTIKEAILIGAAYSKQNTTLPENYEIHKPRRRKCSMSMKPIKGEGLFDTEGEPNSRRPDVVQHHKEVKKRKQSRKKKRGY